MYFYWGRGSCRIPDIDLLADKEPDNPLALSTPRLMAFMITNPLMPAFIMLGFTIWGGALMSSIYTPLYEEYSTGCVNHGENGTFITNNLYSLAYNWASQDGDTETFKGFDTYDIQRSEVCTQYGSNSATKENDDIATLNALIQSHFSSAKEVDTFNRCIDSENLDLYWEHACCGQEGYEACGTGAASPYDCPMNELAEPTVPYTQFSGFLTEQTCSEKIDPETEKWKFDNAIFDCEALPVCQLSCGGPNKRKMKAVTENCGCMVEWFGHSVWLKVSLSIFIYVLMNMSRVALIMGVTRLVWKKIHPGLFNYKATCDREGGLVVKYDKTVEGEDPEHEIEGRVHARVGKKFSILLKEQLDIILPKFKKKGYPQILFALLINAPWIYLLYTISIEIAYK